MSRVARKLLSAALALALLLGVAGVVAATEFRHLQDHLYLGDDNYVYGRYKRQYSYRHGYNGYQNGWEYYYKRLFPYSTQTLADYCAQHSLQYQQQQAQQRYQSLTPYSKDWRQSLVDLAMQERRSALEHNEFLEAVQALGLRDKIPYAQGNGNYGYGGYGQAGAGQGAAGQGGAGGSGAAAALGVGGGGPGGTPLSNFGLPLGGGNFLPFEFNAQAYFAQQGGTPYTLRYSTLADVYGKTNTEILYNQAQNLVQGAQQAAREAVSGHQATLQMEVDGRNRVAEIIAQGQSAAASIQATAEALRAAQPQGGMQIQARGAAAVGTGTVTEQPAPADSGAAQPQQPQQPQQPPAEPTPPLNQEPFAALQQHCAGCHGGQAAEKGLWVDGSPLSPENFKKSASRVLARTMPPADKPELALTGEQMGDVLRELSAAADAYTGEAGQ